MTWNSLKIYRKLREMKQSHDDANYESIDICLVGRLHRIPIRERMKLIKAHEKLVKGGEK